MTDKIVVAESIADEGLEILRGAGEVDIAAGLPRDRLKQRLADADALIVRSGTQVDADLIAAAPRLRAVGRAGVGVDNIDLDAASERGVTVLNAGGGNTVSAAELAVSLVLAASRHLVEANASLRADRWERSAFIGAELVDRVAGLIGLGRVGASVARRLQALEMTVIAYDPFLPEDRARALGVELVELDELLSRAQVVSLHTAPTPGAPPLIGPDQLALMRPDALLVNTARGSLVDEAALLDALDEERITGAALDVFTEEPAIGNPLIAHPRVLATPHLGASTTQAQQRVAVEIARDIAGVLQGKPAANAVNAPFIDPETLEAVGPYLAVADMCGRIATQLSAQLAGSQLRGIRFRYCGEIAAHDATPLKAAATAGMLAPISDEHVNLVSVNNVIRRRGWHIIEEKTDIAEPFTSAIEIDLDTADGRTAVLATLEHGHPAIVEIDGFAVHIAAPRRPSDHLHLLVLRNEDRPGRIGAVGVALGEMGINIQAMDVGRREEEEADGKALMALKIHRQLTPDELHQIEDIDGIERAAQAEM